MGVVVYVGGMRGGGGVYMYINWLSLFGSISLSFCLFCFLSYNICPLPSFSFFLSFTLSLCLVSFPLGFNSRAFL